MKIISTLALSLILVSFAFAQSPRTVLIEEVTNASCGPCAGQNPAFDALLEANTDKAVVIKYQYNFPGYDPMNGHNPTDVANRGTYYSIDGVPTAMLDGKKINGSYPGFDGQWYDGAPGGYSQATLNHGASITSPFELDLEYTMTETGITINAGATCTEATSGNLKFHVVVIEKQINFETAPGTNGETQFNNIMKKMLPTAVGETMAASYEVGETFTTEQTWNFANVYNLDRIAVVVYVQNDANKTVLQARELFKPYWDLDAEVNSLTGLPRWTCDPTVTPSVTIRNNGEETLTSLDVNYEVNDVSGTVNWTGSLEFYETAVVNFDPITFTPDGNDVVEITVSNPNNGVDAKATNNTTSKVVNMAPDATLDITVEIHTDYYPGETSWEIRNSSNVVVASAYYVGGGIGDYNGGGPDANTVKTHQVMLDPYDCNVFKLMDSFNDGMQYGPQGSAPFGYKLIDGNGDVMVDMIYYGFNFGSSISEGMITTNLLKVDEIATITSIEMYPNPAHSNVNIAFELTEPDHITIDVVNILGQVVRTNDLGTLSSGYTLKNIDVSNLPSGLYLINIGTKDSKVVRKLTIVE